MLETLCSEVLATDATSAEANVKSMDGKLEAIGRNFSYNILNFSEVRWGEGADTLKKPSKNAAESVRYRKTS